MRSFVLLLGALVCLRPLAADTPTTPAPTPTVNTTPLSNPPVTPDATFTDAGYVHKWPHIDLAETQRLMKKKGTVLVDGRSLLEWQQSHLPGALALPLSDFEPNYQKDLKKLKSAKIIIAYCHGKGCHLSDSLCQNLVNKGFSNVAVFWGGFPDWNAAHLPLYDKNEKLVSQDQPKQASAPAAAPATKTAK